MKDFHFENSVSLRDPHRHDDEPLYVIAVISNPRRFKSRAHLYQKFAKYVADSGAILITVEAAYGRRPFEVTQANNPFHVQLRTSEELWHKENMINVGLTRLPADWKYVAWVDADITFARPDWVAETKHALQHHHVVQMFSVCQDLSPTYEPFNRSVGFVKTVLEEGFSTDESSHSYYGRGNGHPGYAWAATREAMDMTGGVFDKALLGAGDRHMAYAMFGCAQYSCNEKLHPNYTAEVMRWQRRALGLKKNIGYIDGLVVHQWHGKKSDRRYHDRWKILVDHQFDPVEDIHKDSQGLWVLNADRDNLRDGIRGYFRSRNEDSIDME